MKQLKYSRLCLAASQASGLGHETVYMARSSQDSSDRPTRQMWACPVRTFRRTAKCHISDGLTLELLPQGSVDRKISKIMKNAGNKGNTELVFFGFGSGRIWRFHCQLEGKVETKIPSLLQGLPLTANQEWNWSLKSFNPCAMFSGKSLCF